MEEVNLKIAEFIRLHREERNLTLVELEKQSGVSRRTLSRIERTPNFAKANTNIRTIYKILNCFNKSLKDLFDYVYGPKN